MIHPSEPARTICLPGTCSSCRAAAAKANRLQLHRTARELAPENLAKTYHSNRARPGCKEESATGCQERSRTEKSCTPRFPQAQSFAPSIQRALGWRWLRDDGHQRYRGTELL